MCELAPVVEIRRITSSLYRYNRSEPENHDHARSERVMAELVRTGVSIKQELLEKIEKAIAERGYGNRSEALRRSHP